MMWVVLVTVALLVVGLLYFLRSSTLGTRQTLALIVGPSGSGKTLLFQRLVKSRFVSTTTSLAINARTLAVGHKMIRLLDVPGHGKLTPQTMLLADKADCLVVVVDSTDREQFSASATVLYDLLLLESLPSKRLLLLVNKADSAEALPANVLTSELEAEMLVKRG